MVLKKYTMKKILFIVLLLLHLLFAGIIIYLISINTGVEEPRETNGYPKIILDIEQYRDLEKFSNMIDSWYPYDWIYVTAAKVHDRKLWLQVWDIILDVQIQNWNLAKSITSQWSGGIELAKKRLDDLFLKIKNNLAIIPTQDSEDIEVIFSTIPLQEAFSQCDNNINLVTQEEKQTCKYSVILYRATSDNNLCDSIDAEGESDINTRGFCRDLVAFSEWVEDQVNSGTWLLDNGTWSADNN